MTKYYKAIFSDGIVKKRASCNEYTHAWLVGNTIYGFSGNHDLAARAAKSALGNRPGTRCEVVSVVEITRKEYRYDQYLTRTGGLRA